MTVVNGVKKAVVNGVKKAVATWVKSTIVGEAIVNREKRALGKKPDV